MAKFRCHPISLIVFLVGAAMFTTGLVLAIVFGTKSSSCPTPPPCPAVTTCKPCTSASPTTEVCDATLFSLRTGINPTFVPWDPLLSDPTSQTFLDAQKKVQQNLTMLLQSSPNSFDLGEEFGQLIDSTKRAQIRISEFGLGDDGIAIAIGFGTVYNLGYVPTVEVIESQIRNDTVIKRANASDSATAFCLAPNFGNNATSTTVFVTTNTPQPQQSSSNRPVTSASQQPESSSATSPTSGPQNPSTSAVPNSSPTTPSTAAPVTQLSSGPVTQSTSRSSGTSQSTVSGQTSVSTSPTTSGTLAYTTTNPCPRGYQKVQADIAIVYELGNSNNPIYGQIDDFVGNVLFNYAGNPYALGQDINRVRFTKVAPIPYPNPGEFPLIPKQYGNQENSDALFDVMTTFLQYRETFPPPAINIKDGLDWVLNNVDHTLYEPSGRYWPNYVILIGNSDSTVGDATQTAQYLKDNQTEIFTISFNNSNAKFTSLANNQSDMFNYFVNSPSDYEPVARAIGDILWTMSGNCFNNFTTPNTPGASSTSMQPSSSPSTSRPTSPSTSPSTSTKSTQPPSPTSSPSSVTTTSPTPTPTTTCPCNGRAFYGDLAVVFELKDPALDITRNIENYIERSLLNYTGNPYILGWDCDIPATMLVLLPYPRTFDYSLFSNHTYYGMIFDMDKVVTQIESGFNVDHPDITSITVQDGLEYQYNFCYDQESIDYIPPKFTILIANGNDDPNSAKQIADEMKRNNFTIVTLAFMTDKSKIAGLASDPSYEFQLDSTDQFDTVSNQIGKTLFDLSNRCVSSGSTSTTGTSPNPSSPSSSPNPTSSPSTGQPTSGASTASPPSSQSPTGTTASQSPNTGTTATQPSPSSSGTPGTTLSPPTSGPSTSQGSSPTTLNSTGSTNQPTSGSTQTGQTTGPVTSGTTGTTGPVTSGTTGTGTSSTGSTQTSTTPTPTTSSGCIANGGKWVYYGDLAVAFELMNASSDREGIKQFVRQVLLTSQGVSYEFDPDATYNQYTWGSLFAYPKTSSYAIAPRDYNDITNQNSIDVKLGLYDTFSNSLDTSQPDIQDAFNFISGSVTQTPNIPMRAVILVANDATKISDAVASAEALKNAGYVIITIAHSTYSDFSQLATQPSYAFHIYPNETQFAESQAVAINVSNLLVSLSKGCFYSTLPTSPNPPTTPQTTTAVTTSMTTTACPPGPQMLAIAYEINKDPLFYSVSNYTRDFILNLAQQTQISTLLSASNNLSVIAFPVDTFNYSTNADFGQLNGLSSLQVALNIQWVQVRTQTSDILSGLNYVSKEKLWNDIDMNAVVHTMLIIAYSTQGVENATNTANVMKAAGVKIATLAMTSGTDFDLASLATASEYSLKMVYNTTNSEKASTARKLDGLIAKLASPCAP